MPFLPSPQSVSGTQSIDRAVLLLQLIAAHHADGIALSQLIKATCLDRTTVYRIATSLVQAGLAEREAQSSLYRLGQETMALGATAMQRPPLVERYRPVMKALARHADEPVFLVLRTGDHSQALALEEGTCPIRSFAETVGSMRLLGLGIPSFALLARMSDEAVTAHHARHGAEYLSSRMSLAKLLRWVRQTREQGYAQVTAKGLSGVGVRIALGSCGDAALGIVSTASRMPRHRGPALVAMVQSELARFALV